MENKNNFVARVVTLDGVSREYSATEQADFAKSVELAKKKAREEIIYPTERELAELFAVLNSFEVDGVKFTTSIKDVRELKTRETVTSDSAVMLGCYGNGSNGKGRLISVWCRRKATKKTPVDYGVRFSVSESARFRGIENIALYMDAVTYRDLTFKDNEPRYSFRTLPEVTEFLAHIYTMYEKATATKIAETAQQELAQ